MIGPKMVDYPNLNHIVKKEFNNLNSDRSLTLHEDLYGSVVFKLNGNKKVAEPYCVFFLDSFINNNHRKNSIRLSVNANATEIREVIKKALAEFKEFKARIQESSLTTESK